MEKTTRNVTFASLGISVLLLCYVCFILLSNYKSQTVLQQTILKQFSVENERLAITLSNFFNSRREDLINLAQSRPLEVFFENKALGMSMDYGLKQSIPPIKELFYSLLNRYKTETKSLYLWIAFLDEHGNVLADAYPPDSRPRILSDAKNFLSAEKDKPSVMLRNEGKEIVVSLAYYFKGKYSGQIVAWLQPKYLKIGAVVDSSSSHRISFLVAQGSKIPLSGEGGDLPDIETIRPGEVHIFQIADRKGRKQDVIGVKTLVQSTPFAVVTVVPVDDLFEGLEPKGLLTGLGIFAIAIMGGAVFIYRISIKSLVLGARLDEAQLHKTEILGKNKQLEAEIVERQRAEETLREVNNRLSAILRASPAAIYIVNSQGIVTMWNRAAEQMFGWSEEEAVGKLLPIVPDDAREEFRALSERLLSGESLLGMELRRLQKGGSFIDINIFAAPLYDTSGAASSIIAIATDITLRKKMEEELLKKEKLESLGVLAGGIAHDFNNLLTAILGNISLAKMLAEQESREYQSLEKAESASLRARDLTQQLLTFSKGGDPIKKETSLGDLIRETASFVLRGSKSRCDIVIPDGLWPVEADEGQISQLIHNLILNADQAMPHGGIITVRCENVVMGSEKAGGLKNERYVTVSIKDEGIGISGRDLEKIFDPYFTTKQRGSGLGLTTSYSIVKKHDGHIRVESELGVGTTFHVDLPALDREILYKEKTEEKAHAGRGEKILIMDDEDMVRTVAGEILKTLGYVVEFSSDGSEAIEQYQKAKESNEPFDIVIMDLTIPGGMGGEAAMKKLREIDPHVKAIVSSGYANDPIMSNFREYGFKAVAAKPYRAHELGNILHKVLAE